MALWITGVGQRSALGAGYPAFKDAVMAGASGIKRLDVPRPFGEGLGAPLPDGHGESVTERLARLLRPVLTEALNDARLPCPSEQPLDLAVTAGTNFGNHLDWLEGGCFLDPLSRVMRELGIGGELWGVSTACASGVNCIGLAMDLVRHEGHSRVLACGYDLIGAYNYEGLASLRALSKHKIRPFDKRREGTLLGEGAGAVVVESAESAMARGVRPYVELLGYGSTNDGYHFTAPHPEGRGMRSAMEQALLDAGLGPEAIDHINTHGTGTQHNDRIETSAVRKVFGDQAAAIPITATKPAIGHTMGASGILEALVTLCSLKEQRVPPILGLEMPAPECDLDYVVGEGRPHTMRVTMSNSYGLWGCYASVIMEAPETL